MKTMWIALALVLAIGGLGCNNREIMAPGAPTADKLPPSQYPRVAALEGLDQYLSVSPAVVRGGEASPLSVVVPVRLRSDKEVNIQYRFEFLALTPDGLPVPVDPQQQAEWRFAHLPSRAQFFLQGKALDTTARDWRLVIRPAR